MQNVYWVIPGELAGRCGPSLAPWDCRALYDSGIRAIVSLPDNVKEAIAKVRKVQPQAMSATGYAEAVHRYEKSRNPNHG